MCSGEDMVVEEQEAARVMRRSTIHVPPIEGCTIRTKPELGPQRRNRKVLNGLWSRSKVRALRHSGCARGYGLWLALA